MSDRPTEGSSSQHRSTEQIRSSASIRADFLAFFREKQHEIVPSAPLVPHDDPTLLFINAGMNQFKDVFLGEGSRPYDRAADTQKCLRVSGKHNDLEEVGVDTYHHTFFEMLGNWSFGDYFKKEAIAWAWELLVDRWGLDPDRLYATVHEGDDTLGLDPDEEAADLWKSETTIPHDHVLYGATKDNFWMMGDTGPCGPCSELHVDLRSDAEREQTDGKDLVNADHPEVIEIWNLVFIQYNAQSDGSLKPLAAKHVDTGMGFERICAVLQGKSSTYDTDLFAPLLQTIADLSPRVEIGGYDNIGGIPEPEAARIRIAMRVVADHVRTLAFAIADGASPSNTGRGYVIRRILRRAVRFGYQSLDFTTEENTVKLFDELVDQLDTKMGDVFPSLREQKEYIKRVIGAELSSFLRTLGTGVETTELVTRYLRLTQQIRQAELKGGRDETEAMLSVMSIIIPATVASTSVDGFSGDSAFLDLLEKAYPDRPGDEMQVDTIALITKRLEGNVKVTRGTARRFYAFYEAARDEQVPGEIAFLLHDTYGFPGDLTALMAREEGLTVDEARFSELMEEQRERARAAGSFGVDPSSIDMWEILTDEEDLAFVGYDSLIAEDARVVKARRSGEHFEVKLNKTPFYAESGGQVGDVGYLEIEGEQIAVLNTTKDANGEIVHVLEPRGTSIIQQLWALKAGVDAVVDTKHRRETMKHHTATHLLHAALRETLGEHVQQKGSLVAPDRLRFDFSHFERVTDDEQRRIERRVNELVQQNIEGSIESEVPIAEAKERGAMALFGEKYGETVRVVTFGPEVSVELCGGTHVGATGEIGVFRILSEGSVASGVRRIEAVAGEAALGLIEKEKWLLERVRAPFKSLQKPVDEAVQDVLDEVKALEKEIAALKQEQAASGLDSLAKQAEDVDGIRLITGDIGPADMDTLRETATQFRDKLGPNAVAVLGAADPEGDKVYLAASVSDDLTKRVQAGKLVGVLAKRVGGGGGGRPTLATAGGKQPENLGDALGAAADTLREML